MAFEIWTALDRLNATLGGIEDELNRWRNGQWVGGNETPSGTTDRTVINLDEYGRAPIVQVLTESAGIAIRHNGLEYDLIGYAVDANGDCWPMVRGVTSPRPYVVRDYEGLEQ